MIARKHNITGIKGLSIGTTKNDRGHELKRYSVNYTDESGKNTCASFYFGVNVQQFDAFISACGFMQEIGLCSLSKAKLKSIYSDLKHETLI